MRKLSVFCLSVLLVSCSSPVRRADLFLYNGDDPYVKLFGGQILSALSGEIKLTVSDAQNTQLLQNEQIEGALSRESGLMIINPVDRLGAYAVIKKLKSSGVPVIFFNREPLLQDLKLWEKSWYVGARAEQSGQMQAGLIMELFGNDPHNLNKYDRNADGRIQTVILKGEQGHQDAEIRTAEGIDAFKQGGFDLDILVTEVANWKRDEAYEKMKRILSDYDGMIELVLSNNDAMAMGAISIMRQSGFFQDTNENGRIDRDDEQWIPVAGIDGLDEAVEMIETGYLYATVINDSFTQARAIAELSEMITGIRSRESMNYSIENDKYIWIDYKIFRRD